MGDTQCMARSQVKVKVTESESYENGWFQSSCRLVCLQSKTNCELWYCKTI